MCFNLIYMQCTTHKSFYGSKRIDKTSALNSCIMFLWGFLTYLQPSFPCLRQTPEKGEHIGKDNANSESRALQFVGSRDELKHEISQLSSLSSTTKANILQSLFSTPCLYKKMFSLQPNRGLIFKTILHHRIAHLIEH